MGSFIINHPADENIHLEQVEATKHSGMSYSRDKAKKYKF